MTGKQMLQSRQRHPRQHRDQQRLPHNRSEPQRQHPVAVASPQAAAPAPSKLLGGRIISRNQTDASRQGPPAVVQEANLNLPTAGRPESAHAPRRQGPEPCGPGDHQSRLHGKLQRAAAPQAGEGRWRIHRHRPHRLTAHHRWGRGFVMTGVGDGDAAGGEQEDALADAFLVTIDANVPPATKSTARWA